MHTLILIGELAAIVAPLVLAAELHGRRLEKLAQPTNQD